MLVGGSGYYIGNKSGPQAGDKQRQFGLSANFGYFVVNRLAVGIRPGITAEKLETSIYKQKNRSYSLGPFARYYILPVKNKMSILAEAQYNYSHYKYMNTFPAVSTTTNKVETYTVGAGPAFFLNKNISLELTGNYQRTLKTKQERFIAMLGFQLHI